MQKSVERRATELCGASEDETDGRTTLDVDDGEKYDDVMRILVLELDIEVGVIAQCSVADPADQCE
ncbi:hypothetical protein HDV03_001076 [Kappamyces sp. JEL0829]|nr:hypothetical protein HDV03_001076 [Kappamyces sp. JEL0829]